MPIRKDEHGKRWVEMEIIVPGTPEQVWQAVATGPGCTAWFTRTEIEQRIGGTILFDLGPYGSSKGEVTIWEPPLRFGYVEREWSEDAPPVETEITVTSRSDGNCLFHMTHALVASTDDWDASLEGFEKDWPGFFQVLRLYLTHFAGFKAAAFQAMASVETPQLDVWKRLIEALGLAGANVGEEQTTPRATRAAIRNSRARAAKQPGTLRPAAAGLPCRSSFNHSICSSRSALLWNDELVRGSP